MKGTDKTWTDTRELLSEWLSVNVGGAKSMFDEGIMRAHRGAYNPDRVGPRPIFVKFNDRIAEKIREKMKLQHIGGISISDQFCKNTQERLNRALLYRKNWKADPVNAGGKAHIIYPATLKTRKTTDSGYRVEKVF